MERYTLVPFGDTGPMVSERWHEMLFQSYGKDYMTPRKYVAAEFEAHDIMRGLI